MRTEQHQQREPSFPARGQKDEPCPSCNLEERLSRTVVTPRRDRIKRIKDCEDCGGTGRVPRVVRPRQMWETQADYEERVYRDPYEEGARERSLAGVLGQTSSLPSSSARRAVLDALALPAAPGPAHGV